MSIDTMEQQIRSFRDKDCGGGATPSQIAEAENLIRVAFPQSYRAFLQEFGWGRFSYEELYGLGVDVPPHLDLIKNTVVERSQMQPALPPPFIPIMNDGGGNHYCLDTSRTENGECPVVFWDHEMGPDQQADFVSSSFDVWIVSLLADLDRPIV